MLRYPCLVLPLFLTSCAGAAASAGPPGDLDHDRGIVDAFDRCSLLGVCPGEDEGGCPDLSAEFDEGSVDFDASSLRLLADTSRAFRDRADEVSKVRIIGTHGVEEEAGLGLRRARAVRDYLVADSIPEHVLETMGTPAEPAVGRRAWLDVVSCL